MNKWTDGKKAPLFTMRFSALTTWIIQAAPFSHTPLLFCSAFSETKRENDFLNIKCVTSRSFRFSMLHTVNFASNNFSTKTVSFFKVKVIRPFCILKQDKTKWSWHIVETNYTVDRWLGEHFKLQKEHIFYQFFTFLGSSFLSL